LDDDQHGVAYADFRDRTVGAGPGVGECLAESYYHSQQLLRALVQLDFLRVVHIQGNDAGSDQQLEDPACGDDGGESQLHEGAPVGGEYDPHPVEGVAALGPQHPVDGDLAADEVDEESDGRVEDFLFVVDEAVGLVDEGEDVDRRLKNV